MQKPASLNIAFRIAFPERRETVIEFDDATVEALGAVALREGMHPTIVAAGSTTEIHVGPLVFR
jgi:hypothetical protein